jgi:hypothetical protein
MQYTNLFQQLQNAGLPVISADDSGAITMGAMTDEQDALFMAIIAPPFIPATEQVFALPIRAPIVTAADFIVQSPKPKVDPLEALTEAIGEAAKADKSVALIVLDLVKYLEDVEKRLKKAKV